METPSHHIHLRTACETMAEIYRIESPPAAKALREISMREQEIGKVSFRGETDPYARASFRGLYFAFVHDRGRYNSTIFTNAPTKEQGRVYTGLIREVFNRPEVTETQAAAQASRSLLRTAATEAARRSDRYLLAAVVLNQENQDGSFFHEILYPRIELDEAVRLRELAFHPDSQVREDIKGLLAEEAFNLPDTGPLKRLDPDFVERLSFVAAMTYLHEQHALGDPTPGARG